MSNPVSVANDLIKKYDLSIPVDLNDLLEKLNISLSVTLMKSMSGFAYQKNDQRIIGVNIGDGEKRRRFTTAHELGHMLLHGDSDKVIHDGKNDFVYFRDDNSSTGLDSKEVDANKFAAELLMPKEALTAKITELGGIDLIEDGDKVMKLADEFNVSFTAMSVRIESLARQT